MKRLRAVFPVLALLFGVDPWAFSSGDGVAVPTGSNLIPRSPRPAHETVVVKSSVVRSSQKTRVGVKSATIAGHVPAGIPGDRDDFIHHFPALADSRHALDEVPGTVRPIQEQSEESDLGAYGTHFYKARKWKIKAWWIGRFIAPVLVGLLGYAVWHTIIDFAWVTVLAATGYGIILKRPRNACLPEISPVEMGLLRDDVVNGVFANVLERGHRRLEPGMKDALQRGWLHLQFISHITSAMATPPFVWPEDMPRAA